ncbi:MAG TPA: serine/threonine-protein kinase, partial [Longimicrobiales bacterium]|nr:serine/threonine-protein kinase [Longimicrobiales bacterium]
MTSDRELWQRARSVFDELVELEPGPRAARLAEIGRTDPVLRDEVERLLSADRDAEAALQEYSFGSTAGTPGPASLDPLGITGQTVAHFRIREFVAAGGMGVVYSAEDLTLGRTVALKFPLPHQQLAREVKERFINEARSAASLDHPALCSIHEIGESEHGVFLAMPLYPGETLKDRMAREGRLDSAAALEIAHKVTSGLAAAHAAGIIHRDLKPGNVMLLPDGAVKVLDFGLAKIRDVDLTRSHMTLGTIGYVAPEQLRGERADAPADLWAIGVIFYEMLIGTTPFRRDHELSVLNAVLHDEPQRPSVVNPELSSGFDDLIGALLRKDPAERYPSADALLADLAALQRGGPIALRTPFWSRTERRRRARKLLIPAAAVAALAVGGVTWGALASADARRSSVATGGAAVSLLKWIDDTAEIGSSAELAAALDPANAGRRIRLRPGVYDIDQPLTVPDRMTLEGAGVMRFDSEGRPTGFGDDTRTTLRMTANVGGDVLTLGDGVTLRNIEIADLAGRSGNVVAVVSRRAGDSISATIIESVIANPNPLTIGAGGPLGRALLVITWNPNMGSDPPPHEGSALSVTVTRSMIRSPEGGGGLFAFNFAADSRIIVDLSHSVIGGSNEAVGGVSRPDAVHDSEVFLQSQGNLYRNEWPDPCVSPLIGWNLAGGSGSPIPIPLPPTTRNRLIVRSVDDRIERFPTTVLATGSRRFFGDPLNPPPTDNSIDLQLIGTVISTPDCAWAPSGNNTVGIAAARMEAAADFRLTGAWVGNDALNAGDRNTVRVEFRGVTASGPRMNQYAHTAGT